MQYPELLLGQSMGYYDCLLVVVITLEKKIEQGLTVI